MKLKQYRFSTYLTLALIFVAFVFSLVIWFVKFPGIRKVFIFPSSLSQEQFVESRYIQHQKEADLIKSYVQELLLGPINELSRPLFSKQTKLVSCFLRNGVLYAEFSDDLLNSSNFSVDYKESFSLFEKNIKRNFSKVKSVEFYINGTEGPFKIFENQ